MNAPDALVVTELFPPAVGGSGFLLREVYRRFAPRRVTVVTDRRVSAGPDTFLPPTLTVEWADLATPAWGIGGPAGTLHHFRVARRIRRASNPRRTVIHCARALPEGVPAWANHAFGGARYVCWGHGEDVTMALTSREQTWVMARVYRSASAVIANSRNTQASLMNLGLKAGRVHIVYPGVNPSRFHPDVNGGVLRRSLLQGGDTLLLSVGRLQRRKGHDLAIEAVAALKDSLPGLRYVIVGDGDRRPHLERLVSELRVGDRVTFCGTVPEEMLPAYFAASDVFVLPNRRDGPDVEGFGIVFLEAAASGRPSIGGNSGGVSEAVDHDRTGLLVSGTDARELAEAIRRLARNPDERAAFGRAGRTRVLSGFTWDHAAAKVAAIHDRVLAGG